MALGSGALKVIFRDAHLLLVDKPPGMPVQPDRTGDPSLKGLVQADLPERQVGSPHRLDRPVSGLVVFALDRPSLTALDAAFRKREVDKTYLAIVEGRPADEGELVHRMGHRAGSRKAWARPVEAGEDASARLRYTVKATGERYSLLEVVPDGGAFHQIRAQLAAAGFPIKGDVKYGARRGERDRSIALHAWKLAFSHPVTGARLQFEAPLPGHGSWPVFRSLMDA